MRSWVLAEATDLESVASNVSQLLGNCLESIRVEREEAVWPRGELLGGFTLVKCRILKV